MLNDVSSIIIPSFLSRNFAIFTRVLGAFGFRRIRMRRRTGGFGGETPMAQSMVHLGQDGQAMASNGKQWQAMASNGKHVHGYTAHSRVDILQEQ